MEAIYLPPPHDRLEKTTICSAFGGPKAVPYSKISIKGATFSRWHPRRSLVDEIMSKMSREIGSKVVSVNRVENGHIQDSIGANVSRRLHLRDKNGRPRPNCMDFLSRTRLPDNCTVMVN